MRWQHTLASITQRLRPISICVLCNQRHDGTFVVCHDCSQFFIPLGPACLYCATPLKDDDTLLCGACQFKKPVLDFVTAGFRFQEPLRTLVHHFKYHDGLYLKTVLGQAIIQSVPMQARKTQCLIPIPLHPKRLRKRGFNQSAELAKYLGAVLNIPCELSLCKKIINTASQAELDAKQRQQNLLHAFQAKSIPYQHVTLIDDLITTGNTANALARVIKQQGVKRVDLWCCARGI